MPTPEFFTVEETAGVLRIGRTAAYEATRRYRATNGAEGIPCYKVGGSLRVPRHKLEEIAGGPIELPSDAPAGTTSAAPRSITDRPAPAESSCRPSNGDDSDQQAFDLSA